MNLFFKKIFYFSFPIIVLTLIVISLISYANQKPNKYKLNKNISTIYAGDSHIQFAINDSIINNGKNIAISSESYYFSYFKLKMLLNENLSIDTIYLGLSYHSLSSYYDDFVYGKYSAAVAPRYFYLLPFNEQVKIIQKSGRPLPFITSVAKKAFKLVSSKNTYDYMGGFESYFHNTKAKKTSIKKRVSFQYFNNNKLNSFSELNIYYLDKIIELCKSKGVELYTLNTPLHSYYYKNVPQEYKQKLLSIIKSRKLKYIDLSQLKLNDNNFMPDGDHVSNIGAIETTKKMKKLIKNKFKISTITTNNSFSDKLQTKSNNKN